MVWVFITLVATIVFLFVIAKLHQVRITKRFNKNIELKKSVQFGVGGVVRESFIDENGIRVITEVDIQSVSILPSKTLH